MDDIITTEALPAAEFKIFTGILRAFKGADGKRRLQGIASSTTEDLHGDTMEETALRDMERDANDNLTIFLNHSYQVPEDVAGSVEKATVTQRGVDGEGNPNWDLDYQIVVNETNKRAIDSWEAIQGGTKLGLSIGAMIPAGGALRDKKTGALTIAHVKLLETSVVSIPANPRSWISNAVKALRSSIQKSQSIGLGQPQLELDGTNYTIRGTLDGIQIAQGIEAEVTMDVIVSEDTITIQAGDVVAMACSECGGTAGSPKGGCKSGYHKDIEPEVQDASVRIIEIDTDPKGPADQPSSQGAPESEPETETLSASAEGTGADSKPDVTAGLQEPLDPAVRRAIEQVGLLLETTTARLVEAREQLSLEKQAREQAETQRDEATAAAVQVIAQVKVIVEKLADTPIGRKTKFVEAKQSFAHLEQIYSQPFLKLLTQGEL
jgi:phage head maturation protease